MNSEISSYIKSKKAFQEILLKYISSEDNTEENYENLGICIKDQNISENTSELKILLYMLMRISNFHLRPQNFFEKIEKIILNFKDIITTKFTNDEIYQIFQTSKRLLLFLIEEKILKFDEKIYLLNKSNIEYLLYFYPEFSNFMKAKSILSINCYNKIVENIKNNEEDFRKKRKVGENDSYICELIRKDDIDNFISYINRNQISLNSNIKSSIYETNTPLIKLCSQNDKGKQLNLIVYTLYFGSNQIFNYLYKNNVTLSSWMLPYAIHGGDPSIIQIFEENSRLLSNNLQLFFESSIEFFNTDAARYIQRKHPRSSKIQSTLKSIEYYNFIFFPKSLSADDFSLLCKNGYLQLAKYVLKNFPVEYNMNFLVELIKDCQFDIFKLLFESSSYDIMKSKSFTRENLLGTAVNMENVDLVRYLLESNKIDPNQMCQSHIYHSEQYYSGTALCFAIRLKNPELTSLLLNHPKVDVNGLMTDSFSFAEDDKDHDEHTGRLGTVEYKKTPLIIAIENNDVKTIELLLKKPDINVNINRIFKYEYEFTYEYFHFHRNFINKDFDCNKKGKCEISPFLLALMGNDVNVVKLLLSKDDIDINSEFNIIKNSEEIIQFIKKVIYRARDKDDIEGKEIAEIREKISPISYAIENCDSEILDALLDSNKVNTSFYGNTLLKRAILIRNDSLIQNLFSNSNFDFQNALKNNLITAVQANNMVAFGMLLERPEVNVNDNDGVNTALIAALKMNNMEAFNQLLERPEININDNVGYETALKAAIEENNLVAVNALLDRNDINVNDNNGDMTALKIAVDKGELEIVKVLLARNDIDVNDNSGDKTALKLAVKNGFHEIVALLLDKKEIDVNDNCSGVTAIKLAADNLDIEMVKLLTTHPEILFDPETIYNDVNHDKLSIILYLVNLKNKK